MYTRWSSGEKLFVTVTLLQKIVARELYRMWRSALLFRTLYDVSMFDYASTLGGDVYIYRVCYEIIENILRSKWVRKFTVTMRPQKRSDVATEVESERLLQCETFRLIKNLYNSFIFCRRAFRTEFWLKKKLFFVIKLLEKSLCMRKYFYKKKNLDFSAKISRRGEKKFVFSRVAKHVQKGGSSRTSNQPPTNLYSI